MSWVLSVAMITGATADPTGNKDYELSGQETLHPDMKMTHLNGVPPLASPHLTVYPLLARRVSEQASWAIHNLVRMFRVPEECAYRLNDVAELKQVLLSRSVFEGYPSFLPLRPLWK